MALYIGLTGPMGSGKGEIGKILEPKGFKYISLSDMVRKEATQRGVLNERPKLQDLGNEMRQAEGAGVLGKRVREEILQSGENLWVIDGVRNPAEIVELRQLPEFRLVGVTAERDVLVQRVLSRQDTGDSQSEVEIMDQLEREHGRGEPEDGQQVAKCIDQADFLILNEGTLVDLQQKTEHFLGLLNGSDRPTFDEIFMEVAYSWAKRATCLRRKVGAVLAKEKQQLTTGYNGAPTGLPHCAELGGCLREKLGIPSGQRHEICRGTHAEQNAITQAAKLGINIEGGTIYTNTFPCVICTKMILNAGIKKVVYDATYNDPLSKEILSQQNRVEIVRYEGKKYRV